MNGSEILGQSKLEAALKGTPMFPLTRIKFLKFVAAGAFVVALSAANIHASAEEMVQSLGPVGPNGGVLATIGTMHVVAFFEPTSGRCAVNAVVFDAVQQTFAGAGDPRRQGVALGARQ